MNVNKEALSIIDRKRVELLLSCGDVVSREDMLLLLLQKGQSELGTDELKRRRESGVICITPECDALPGRAVLPPPHELAARLKECTSSFTVVFGEPGSGVSVYMEQVSQLLRHEGTVITLCDDGPGPVNIFNGMVCFERGGNVLAAVTADSYEDALQQIMALTRTKCLTSREFQAQARDLLQ